MNILYIIVLYELSLITTYACVYIYVCVFCCYYREVKERFHDHSNRMYSCFYPSSSSSAYTAVLSEATSPIILPIYSTTTTDTTSKGNVTTTLNAGPSHTSVSAGNMQYVSIADGDENSSSRTIRTYTTPDQDNGS